MNKLALLVNTGTEERASTKAARYRTAGYRTSARPEETPTAEVNAIKSTLCSLLRKCVLGYQNVFLRNGNGHI